MIHLNINQQFKILHEKKNQVLLVLLRKLESFYRKDVLTLKKRLFLLQKIKFWFLEMLELNKTVKVIKLTLCSNNTLEVCSL